MNGVEAFQMPSVSDDEIRWACSELGMKADAFFGVDGADLRASVLKLMERADVAACPGSGKTTLLVAKLAILGAKWPYRTRGLCVLSHTNVARIEIEKRLGHTSAGRRLLGHPHYIGTIHGFVNEFLAIPWLLSQGYRIKLIDTTISQLRRWHALPWNIRSALESNHHSQSVLSAKAFDFGVGQVRWGKNGTLGPETATYLSLRQACRDSMMAGYFCYDEMFMWANDLMDRIPAVTETIRGRFPLLLLDEAQDTSEDQAKIIHRIFTQGESPATNQRFGDGNQAIFDSTESQGTTAADLVFPLTPIQRDLPTSHRFGQTIANFADPFGVKPYNLKGNGPKVALASGAPEAKHTIFVFDHQAGAEGVLPAFAELLLNTFSAQELNTGTFKAVGQVHQNKGDDHFPGHVGHYWRDYDPALSRAEPKPETFVQYVFAGISKSGTLGETQQAVEKIAEGILQLATLGSDGHAIGEARERNRHRRVLRLLKPHPAESEAYQQFITEFGIERQHLTKELWNLVWCTTVGKIGEAIAGEALAAGAGKAFLAWKDGVGDEGGANAKASRRENFQRYVKDDKEVTIYLGSIHSVKGETHMATLVLETFWYSHNLGSIKDWLLGKRSGGDGAKDRDLSRLKLHYVAMTRPSHLLCLALPRSSLCAKAPDGGKAIIDGLKVRGWAIHEL